MLIENFFNFIDHKKIQSKKNVEALQRDRMKAIALETIEKPIEFIFNGNFTQEEIMYFMEERKRLEEKRNKLDKETIFK